jgi:hypothetical protein
LRAWTLHLLPWRRCSCWHRRPCVSISFGTIWVVISLEGYDLSVPVPFVPIDLLGLNALRRDHYLPISN